MLGVLGLAGTLAFLVLVGGSGAVFAWIGVTERDPAEGLAIGGIYMMIGVAGAIGGGLLAVPSMLTGWSLLRGRAGGVPAAVAISGLAAVFFFPAGTVLGVYAIWALCFDPGRDMLDVREPVGSDGGAGWLIAGVVLTLLAAAVGLGVPMALFQGPILPLSVGAGLVVFAIGALVVGVRGRIHSR